MTPEQLTVFEDLVVGLRAAAEQGVAVLFNPEEAGGLADVLEGVLDMVKAKIAKEQGTLQ